MAEETKNWLETANKKYVKSNHCILCGTSYDSFGKRRGQHTQNVKLPLTNGQTMFSSACRTHDITNEMKEWMLYCYKPFFIDQGMNEEKVNSWELVS